MKTDLSEASVFISIVIHNPKQNREKTMLIMLDAFKAFELFSTDHLTGFFVDFCDITNVHLNLFTDTGEYIATISKTHIFESMKDDMITRRRILVKKFT